MKEPLFHGVATAVVTPFYEDQLDLAAFDRILEQQVAAKIDAIVVCGTTGEASTLTTEEKATLWRHAASYLGGRAKLIAGVGTNDTRTSVAHAVLAKECGADGLLAVTPYYNKCSQEGLARHYEAIADATDLPLITYNVPSRTGVDLKPDTCARLMRHPHINGIKEAGGSITRVAELRHLCGDSFAVWSGNDDQITAMMALGASGVISVLSNIRPRAVKALTEACLSGDFKTASKLQIDYLPLIKALFSDVNPIPVKAALAVLGICREEVRLPLCPISPEARTRLHAALLTCPELSA